MEIFFISAFLEAAALLCLLVVCAEAFFFFSCIFYFLLPAIGQGRSRQTPATTSDDDRPSSNRLNNFISENFFRRSMNIFQMPARRLRKKEIIDVLKLAPPDGSIWLWAPKFFPVNFVRFRRMAGESRRFSPVEIHRWVRYGRESYFGGRRVGGWGVGGHFSSKWKQLIEISRLMWTRKRERSEEERKRKVEE